MRRAPLAALLINALLLVACGPEPAPAPPPDPTQDPAYKQAVEQLASTADQAQKSFAAGKPDEAAALIEKAEPIENQVLAVTHPTLGAMEAATDLDEIYGTMLLSNQHYAWALFLFQKCSARWKYWQPQTEDTARRLAKAESEIADCQRRMSPHTPPAKRRATKAK